MKSISKLLLGFLFLTTSSLALAQAVPTPTPPPDLGDKMQEMAAEFKILSKQYKDPTQNADSANHAETLANLIQEAMKLDPPKVAKVTPADQRLFLVSFHAAIAELLNQVYTLESDFLKNDNVAAQADMTAINTSKTNGHNNFKD